MAVAYIREYAEALIIQGHMLPVGVEPALADQTLAIGGASAPSNALNAKTKFVEIHVDAIASYVVAGTPVATTVMMRLGAGERKFFGVKAGQGMKIAVIANT